MAINPISYQVPQAFSGGADFTPLAKLGDVYQAQQDRQAQQTALAQLGGGEASDTLALIRSGVPSLATIGLNMQNKVIERQREDQANALEKAHWEAKFALLKDEAERKNMTPLELAQEKTKAWVALGKKVGDPGYDEYVFGTTQSATNKAGLSPVWGTRKNEAGQDEPVMLQTTGSGKAIATELPPGVKVSNEPMKIEGPTGTTLIDPYTHQQIGFIPKDVAGAAQQKAVGEAKGEAQAVLPKVESDAKLVLNTIDKALAPHPGKAWSVGTMFKDVPAVPGTPTADYRAILDQLESQRFLEAYNSLRGGGAISNYEDRRASDAKARLQRAQSVTAFNEALHEYRDIVQSGIERARTMAGQAKPQTGGGADPLGIR
jgi:hypothetical protein